MKNVYAKKILICFGLSFIFVFLLFMTNQIVLLTLGGASNQLTFSQFLTLLFYSLPSLILPSLPFSVCLGFAYALIKLNFAEAYQKNKRCVLPVVILGLSISIGGLIIANSILPISNQNFSRVYRTALSIEENVEMRGMIPREMGSIELMRNRSNFQNDERLFNLYLLELNKNFSIPFGALIFAIYAIALSLVLKKHAKISICITLVSCVVYHVMLMYGQAFSMRSNSFGALAMWLPNIAFLCIAMILYYTGQKKMNQQVSVLLSI